jgi:hypothetical protein
MDPAMQAAMAVGAADASAVGGRGHAATGAGQQAAQQALGGAAGGVVGFTPRGAAAAAVQLQMPLRHAVSRELQVYFDKIVSLILAAPPPSAPASTIGGAAAWPALVAATSSSGGGLSAAQADKQAALLRGAFASLSVDPGLHPLAPYFSAFIADGVKQHLASLAVLQRLLQLTRALLANPGVHLAPYLSQLLPAVVTCVVTKSLGEWLGVPDVWLLCGCLAPLDTRLQDGSVSGCWLLPSILQPSIPPGAAHQPSTHSPRRREPAGRPLGAAA